MTTNFTAISQAAAYEQIAAEHAATLAACCRSTRAVAAVQADNANNAYHANRDLAEHQERFIADLIAATGVDEVGARQLRGLVGAYGESREEMGYQWHARTTAHHHTTP